MICPEDKVLRTIAGKRVSVCGRVREVLGPIVKANLLGVAVGDFVSISTRHRSEPMLARVVSFRDDLFSLSPLGHTNAILPGAEVRASGTRMHRNHGAFATGSLIDAFGRGLDGVENRPTVDSTELPEATPCLVAPNTILNQRMTSGIRTLDCFTPLARGQRLAVFAEPGVGKSSLLQSLASSSDADVVIFALVGERRREVSELYFRDLDAATREKTVVVASTSAEPAIVRAEAVETAMRVAEFHRDKGKHVLLLVDSLTRLLRSLREIGLAAGELPVRRGYPSSVYSALPELIERAGTNGTGTITAFYTLLVSGELDEDPMVEEVKGLCDGHIILRRSLAERGIFPAIDISSSLSRLADTVSNHSQREIATELVTFMQEREEEKQLGLLSGRREYLEGAGARLEETLLAFMKQGKNESSTLDDTHARMGEMARILRQHSRNQEVASHSRQSSARAA